MSAHPVRHAPTKAIVSVLAILALALLLLYLQGTIGGHKVGPGTTEAPPAEGPGGTVVTVEQREIDDLLDWPGTVRSRTVANVAPKVMARVLEVLVDVGAPVRAGDALARLDDRDLKARTEQAQAALAAAEAQAAQATADLNRTRALVAKQAATRQELDAAVARATAATAGVAQARDALTEARVMLEEATVRAPFTGVVGERFVDPGDTVVPGKPVVAVHDPTALRFETAVGERCARLLAIGTQVQLGFERMERTLSARVDEIAPIADPQSRTVLVKVDLPAEATLRPGMFGTLRAACGRHTALLVPATVVTRAGQLERVRVLLDGTPQIRTIRTGKAHGELVEVLAGLQAGERVLSPPQ